MITSIVIGTVSALAGTALAVSLSELLLKATAVATAAIILLSAASLLILITKVA